MLQAADTELSAEHVFGAFCNLCVTTEADLSLAEAAALKADFEAFEFRIPIRRDTLKLRRRIAFRKAGFFLTAEHFVAQEKHTPTAMLNVASLLAKPANFEAVQSLFTAKFGEPNQRDLAGVGMSFASIAGSNARPATYDEAYARHMAGEGDLIDIKLNDVRARADAPSDTISMSYTRWIR